MFAGYGSFIIRDLPFDAIEFVAYEQLKKAWMKYTGSDIRPHESAIIGKQKLLVLCMAEDTQVPVCDKCMKHVMRLLTVEDVYS